MMTLIAFVVAIGLLVAVHEWGHFAMARACGVRVLTFSVGMGPRLASWNSRKTGTEFAIGLLPIGGFVRMLDEREAPVTVAEKPFAFNLKPLRYRVAIVVAGPAANLLLAVLLYACVNWGGLTQAVPVVSTPPIDSIAARAGFQGGETVVRVALSGDESEPVFSFEDFRWSLTRAALAKQDLNITYLRAGSMTERETRLELSTLAGQEADAAMFRLIGFTGPQVIPRLGDLTPGGAAQAAGLQSGDLIVRVDGQSINDASALREKIRSSGARGKPGLQRWELRRGGNLLEFMVQPLLVTEGQRTFGRIGAVIGSPPATVTVHYGFWQGLTRAAGTTWEVGSMTLRTMGQMITGDASVKNLSGPITIADYAGKSAALGLSAFLVFLALISVSLGVLNLLPLPMLDGGHLMYYLWEGVTGRPVSELWTDRLQRLGFGVLMLLMTVAVFNDVARLLA